jgi:PKD repeat protein
MKKILLSMILLFTFAAGMTQNVPRKLVVTEVATATWCEYCPGAAMGVEDMLENGDSVAVIENHDDDNYSNQYSNARMALYNVTGLPTATFDGVLGVVGGNHTTSMYSYYQPLYLQRIVQSSPVSIGMTFTHSGLNYTATIALTKSGTITGSDLRLFFTVTESHIAISWQGQSEINFVDRLMVPDQNGTTISFSNSNTVTTVLNFQMDPSWNLENCEFVAFFQNYTSGQGTIPGSSLNKYEIYQGIKLPVTPLTAAFTSDTTTIDKNGVVNFTNLSYGGFMFVPTTYQWSFPGATPDTSTAENPSATYTQCGPHNVQLIVNAGGLTDTIVKPNYIYVGPYTKIFPIPGDTVCAQESITLNATNPNAASYLWSPGGQTTSMITVDTNGIGAGAHTYSVTITSVTGCTNSNSNTVVFLICTGISDKTNKIDASIFPNPNNGSFMLRLTGGKNELVDLKIMNSLGSAIYSEHNIRILDNAVKNFNLNDVSPGVYYISIQNRDEKIVRKIIIN